jgi:putative ABC transport system permease protein
MNNLKFAFRNLAAHPCFAAAVIITLALGIGANTTVFTLVNAVLFKAPSIRGGDRLVIVNNQNLSQGPNTFSVSYPDFRDFQTEALSFEGLEASGGRFMVISEATNPPERVSAGHISAGMFGLFKTPPILGRTFSSEDDKPGAQPVTIISYRLWQSRYNGLDQIIDRSVDLDGTPSTIIGVMPEGFRFPNNADLWRPLIPSLSMSDRSNRTLELYGVLKHGVSLTEAKTEIGAIALRIARTNPATNQDIGATVQTFMQKSNDGEIRVVFFTMLGAVAFVLLIACANVANLLLSHNIVRERELAVRAAIGASRRQIIRQLLTESLVISSIGGLCGLGISWMGVHAFDVATASIRPFWTQFEMNTVAFAYFAGISILSGIVFGLLPALRASRVNLNLSLKDGARNVTSKESGRLTGSLVVIQFALTAVLLTGAGMMMRSFMATQSLNAFVPTKNLFTSRIDLPRNSDERYATPESRVAFIESVVEKLEALPGVTQAAACSYLPGMGAATRTIEIESNLTGDSTLLPTASFIIQTPQYLPSINLPLLTGRPFDSRDGNEGKESVIVTRQFASTHWPDKPAVGQRLRFVQNDQPGKWMTVIGMSADIDQSPSQPTAPPLLYLPHRQEPTGYMYLLLRTTVAPATTAGPVRQVIQSIDQELPVFELATFPAAFALSNWNVRVFGVLFGTFAAIGLLMASVGIYGVVAQATARRTHEFGIRMALGSTSMEIVRLVVSKGLRQLTLSVILGIALAYGTSNIMEKTGLLFQISARDPHVFIMVPALLAFIGLLACWLPARRATKISPMEALRVD